MIDAIVFVEDFASFVGYLDANKPEALARDEDGNMTMPPVVVGFSRTPAAMKGNSLGAYFRFTDEQAAEWRNTPGVEVLAEEIYTGKGTADRVYQQIWDDPTKLAKYDTIWDRVRTFEDPETGETHTVEQPKFGMIAEEDIAS
jgi:hypothetical protein